MDEPARRRGRRPSGEDARGAIITAARGEFAVKGYEGTTLRGIARVAGVDARLVHHYFDGKDDVFVAAMELPARPQELIGKILDGDRDGIGARLVRLFFSLWDTPVGRQRVLTLLGSALTSEDAARMLREFLAREVFGRIAQALGSDDPQLRAALVASQMMGLAVSRYVIKVAPLAEMDAEDLVPLLGPTVQRYLTGDLTPPTASETFWSRSAPE